VRRVAGESMVPTLMPGRIVLVRSFRTLRVGEVVIVHHDGLEKIKRITMLEDGLVFVTGDNPEQSTDSRSFGWLSEELVIGKLLWPRKHRPQYRQTI
jgi:nickel-type superoxide dismutase maturation protease